MKRKDVRELMYSQMTILNERSKGDIALIALDGLSRNISTIGKSLLREFANDDRYTLAMLNGMIVSACGAIESLLHRLNGLESNEVYDALDEIHSLLTIPEKEGEGEQE